MTHLFKLTAPTVILALALALPAVAEDTPTEPENEALAEGTDLLSEGFKLLLEGLAQEIEPMAEDMADGWAQLVEKFGDLQVYHPPETLPNGDIIIRRRVPLVPEAPSEGETDI